MFNLDDMKEKVKTSMKQAFLEVYNTTAIHYLIALEKKRNPESEKSFIAIADMTSALLKQKFKEEAEGDTEIIEIMDEVIKECLQELQKCNSFMNS